MNCSIFCRTCTKKFILNENLVSIFEDSPLADDKPIRIIEKLQSDKFQIMENDLLPQKICFSCLQQFISIQEFIEQCQISQEFFRNKFKTSLIKKNLLESDYLHDEPADESEFTALEYLDSSVKNEISDYGDSSEPLLEEDDRLNDQIKEEEGADEENKYLNYQNIFESSLEENDYDDILIQNETNYCGVNAFDEVIDENLESNDKSNLHPCRKCSKDFDNLKMLQIHEKSAHEKIDKTLKKHVQENCKQNISSNDEEITATSGKYECDICRRKFTLIISLEKHRFERHINGKSKHNFIHSCQHCGRVYPRKDHLKLHIRNKHLNMNNFICEICGKGFPVQNQKNAHMKIKHSGISYSVECKICAKIFSSIRYLKRHIAENHSEKPEFICVICNQEFYKKIDLTCHSRIHSEKEIQSKMETSLSSPAQYITRRKSSNENDYIELVEGQFIEVQGDEIQIMS